MIRLITFILIFAIFLCFIVLNLENKTDVALGFRTFNNVPIFLSALASFIMGMIFTVPLVFSSRRKKKIKAQAETPEVIKEKKSRSLFRKKPLKEKTPLEDSSSTEQDYVKKEDSPYGID